MNRILGAAGAIALCGVSFAGDIANFGATKRAIFNQYSDGTVSPYLWDFQTRVLFWTPDAYTQGEVQRSSTPEPIELLHYVSSGLFSWDGYFNSQEELDAKYPAELLTFSLSGGFLPPASESIEMPASLFSPVVPHLTGDTAPRLSHVDPSQEFAGTVQPCEQAEGATIAFGTLSIVDLSNGQSVWYQGLLPGEEQFTLPAGTIPTNRAFYVQVTWENRVQQHNAGFDGALGEMIWVQETSMYFNTRLPCQADMNGDGVVDDSDFQLFVIAYNALQCMDGVQPDCPADLNNDGYVLDDDFTIFVVAYDQLLCEPE